MSLALDFSVGVAGAFFDEKDAMYSLSSYSKLRATSYSRSLLSLKACGATGHSYKNMEDKEYKPFSRQASNIARFVRLKYMIPLYGTNEKNEADKI